MRLIAPPVRLIGPLVAACHPAPTVGVTAMTTALVASAGNTLATCCIAALAVLTGQLSIGWSNDARDAEADRAARRPDKPAARGAIDRATLRRAAAAAAAFTIPLSLALGWRAGLVHLIGVGCGWSYNLRLKDSWLSPVPFFVAFAGLPAIATLADRQRWPSAWALVAAGLIGVAGHIANTLPDFEEDLANGISGLPHRIGWAPAHTLGIGCGLAATALIVIADQKASAAMALACSAAVLTITAFGAFGALRRPGSDIAFGAILATAAVNVTLIVASGALS